MLILPQVTSNSSKSAHKQIELPYTTTSVFSLPPKCSTPASSTTVAVTPLAATNYIPTVAHNTTQSAQPIPDLTTSTLHQYQPMMSNDRLPTSTIPQYQSAHNTTNQYQDINAAKLLKSLTWNIEGIRKNHMTLKTFLDTENPDLVFLSEPQIFLPDIADYMTYFKGEYCWELNSEDKVDPELPLIHNKAKGGTMLMWREELDPYITIIPCSSSSFLPAVLALPNYQVSAHIALYMPTAGKEDEFLDQMSQLNVCLELINDKYPDCQIFLRGDSNVNTNNKNRVKILEHLLSNKNLITCNINHKTYHHFMGDGLFDSNIDIVAYSSISPNQEIITRVYCQHDYPDIDSHHDIIMSCVELTPVELTPVECDPVHDDLLTAPRLDHARYKIIWSEAGIADYQDMIAEKLCQLRADWLIPSSATSISILLNLTNDVMTKAASTTNKAICLNKKPVRKSKKKPSKILKSERILRRMSRVVSKSSGPKRQQEKEKLKITKKKHRVLIRRENHISNMRRYQHLHQIITTNPTAAYKTLKSNKTPPTNSIPFVTVGSKKYVGDRVVDGMFDSINGLKCPDQSVLDSSPYHKSLLEDYINIMFLAQNKHDLPPISLEKSTTILQGMKPTVMDFFSVTPLHYINAGTAGLVHFNLMLNIFIQDVNHSTSEELNTIYALLLYKGHRKPKTSDRSYRTISTCPVLAKGFDMYIRDLYIDKWNAEQASTQYQGEGSSHELAALLITEAIQHSVNTSKKPIFLLFLDAQSAFDSVVSKYLARNLYLTGMEGDSLKYMMNRLDNRLTYCEWEKTVFGPIHDQQGVEQGGCTSSDIYKLYNNELFDALQASEQGVDVGGDLVISGVGQADDSGLCANDIYNLRNLNYLASIYCTKYNVKLCQSKTKLLCIQNNEDEIFFNPIQINGEQVNFVTEAKHVGIIKSINGNLPNLTARITAYKKAIGSTLSTGLARAHRANPAACVRVVSMYGTPVASLVMNKTEIQMIETQHKKMFQNVQKLLQLTPPAVVYFLAGQLPAYAVLHLRQLSLFGMITRLPADPLNKRARHVLSYSKASSKSWFISLRNTCLQYLLPHPLQLLDNPLSKNEFKKLINSHVVDFWETKLRQESAPLPSLCYFHPEYMSLRKPHKLWLAAGHNTYEVTKAVQQARFLSGRYRSNDLCKHWMPNNSQGFCTSTTCIEQVETSEHILLQCRAYTDSRDRMKRMWLESTNTTVHQLVLTAFNSPPTTLMQYIVDPSTIPSVISATQLYGDEIMDKMLHLARTWCYVIHRDRMRRIMRWNFLH